MESLSEFHPTIQLTIRRLSNSKNSLQELGESLGITKQAVHKKLKQGVEFLKTFRTLSETPKDVPWSVMDQMIQENQRLKKLVVTLRCQLILAGVERQLLNFFKSQVLKFFPNFRPGRLPAWEKKQILDWLAKFKQSGGLIKTFARKIGFSTETLTRWQAAYDKYGLAGLHNKPTRPKNFGNRVPLFVKEALVLLILKFPRWTPYQYHCHIRHSPTTHWYVSIPTIKKIQMIHLQRTEAEIERLKKRWCFAPGTDVWTIDFTCIIKTDRYKLQILTVSDHRSRFLLLSTLCLHTSTEFVIDQLEGLFIKFGKPKMIKADNGPEFRVECRQDLNALSVYLFNSPNYYGQFNGAHERMHRKLKTFITSYEQHKSLTRLVEEVNAFREQSNYSMPMDYLNGKTPSEIFFNEKDFVPAGAEVITPYEKEGDLRMKFTDRADKKARVSMPIIPSVET